MRRRRIGSLGFEVGAVGIRCGATPQAGARDEAGFLRALHQALDLGVTLVDADEFSGDAATQSALGRALQGRREAVVLAARSGLVADGRGVVAADGRPHQVRRSCDAALRRLRTDRIDLYQLSRPDPSVPVEETWGAMADLVAAGKVRALGICDAGTAALRRVQSVFPVTSVQVELSPWRREALTTALPWCRDRGVGLLAAHPLARRSDAGGPDGSVAHVARRLGATPAQLAVAWVLAQGAQVIALPPLGHPEETAEYAAADGLRWPAQEPLVGAGSAS